ncbi:RecB-like helicase [Helicobacter sp. NHP22-001]|uniref:RecB-like helicase n=1 Tax=Helicobacter sp. NHP22-001 TaxID=3040202 RepID=UPI00244D82A5|nr:RecB-like helicase [Helicobacter sp. NHP22-001]GMB95660.1 Helicase [Helicobacter sp. NHP22-001]
MKTQSAHAHAWLALRASAGSGKTFALTLRYVALLFEGAHPANILTLTFTKKAAAEMYDRIYETLALLSTASLAYQQDPTHQPEPKTQEILEVLQRDYNLSLARLASLNAPKIYADFLQETPPIITIDAFFQQVLRKFSYFVGVVSAFEVGETSLDERLNAFLSHLKPQDLGRFKRLCLLLLTPGRSSVSHALKGFLDLHDGGVDFAPPTAPNVNFKQLEQEIFEAYSVLKIPKQRKPKEDFQAVLKALDTQGAQIALSENPDLKAKIADYFNLREAAILNEFAYFLECYKKHNRNPNRLSFSAITLKVNQLLRDLIDKDFFYFRLDSQIMHILIDEFQDTNPLQFGILKPLVDEIKAGKGQKWGDRSVFFVGDSKQSIYGFRGSKSALFERVCTEIPSQSLEHNYRSTGVVLDFVNATFAPKIVGYTPQKLPEKRQDLADKGYVRVQSVPIADLENEAKVEAVLTGVLNAIKELLNTGVAAQEIAILCFKNDDVNDLKEFLTPHLKGVQIVSATDLSLLAQKEVKALRHALLYTLCPAEQQSYHLANVTKLCSLALNNPPTLPSLNSNLSAHILNLMQTLELFSPSALHFLEHSLEFNDPIEFLEDLEQKNIQIAQSEAVGLKIMTIHKSKGMEFGHVILMDRLSQQATNDTQQFLEYNQRIFYKQSHRKHVDPLYKKALDASDGSRKEEGINVLYVACTRAKESLNIVQKDKESAFMPLGLLDCVKGQLPKSTPKESLATPKPTGAALLNSQKAFGAQEDKNQNQEPKKELEGSRPARIFGLALHKALELFYGYGIGLKGVQEYLHHHYGFEMPTKALLKRLELLEQDKDFKDLLKGQVVAEVGFKFGKDLLRMDMVALDQDNCTILDYKSGEGDIKAHQAQVKGYLQRVQALYPQKNTQAFLVYVLKTQIQLQRQG